MTNRERIRPAAVYEAMVEYLSVNGWTREERGSGWWWKDGCEEEATLGGAVEQQLDADGIDQRVMLPREPQVFWS